MNSWDLENLLSQIKQESDYTKFRIDGFRKEIDEIKFWLFVYGTIHLGLLALLCGILIYNFA